MKIKGAIFDFDGTLFDSMWVWENIDVEFLSRYNKAPNEKIKASLNELSVRMSAKLFKEEFDLPHSVEEIMTVFGEIAGDRYKNDILPKPFVIDFLQLLKKHNIPMCIATASIKNNVIMALERIDILKYFDFIISGEEMKTGKDNPEIFLLCAKKMNKNPQEVFVFEDALHAIKTAKSAGFVTVGVYDKWAENETEAIKSMCHYYINDFSETEVLY